MGASYRGRIAPRRKVTVTLTAETGNAGPTLLMAGAAAPGKPAVGDVAEVAPGGSQSIAFTTPTSGTVVINIDFTDEADTGELDVRVSGDPRDQGVVQGDTDWSYLIKGA